MFKNVSFFRIMKGIKVILPKKVNYKIPYLKNEDFKNITLYLLYL